MAQWYVKDLSKLTGVSVQTLHHYDRIDLLKPSVRLSNGYRIYTEADLLRLQQIIALKFLGFELSQIKALLACDAEALQLFSAQATLLTQKAQHLLDASQALNEIMAEVAEDKSIPWETTIKLIEVYRMKEKLEHTWVKEIFSPEELKQYVEFETALKTNVTSEEKTSFEMRWANLVTEIARHLDQDPNSAAGIAIGKQCMDWVNGVYGKEHANLRTKKFEEGFVKGKGLEEVGLTPEIVAWMDKAMDAYWLDRIYGILNQVGTDVSDDMLVQRWQDLLDDMFGHEQSRKQEIYDRVYKDDAISAQAKAWLKSL